MTDMMTREGVIVPEPREPDGWVPQQRVPEGMFSAAERRAKDGWFTVWERASACREYVEDFATALSREHGEPRVVPVYIGAPPGGTVSEQVKPGYYYEHKNGSVHWKPFWVVDSSGPNEYFDSPLVKRWWRVEAQPEVEP